MSIHLGDKKVGAVILKEDPTLKGLIDGTLTNLVIPDGTTI
jgi:hypothetical protein